MPRLVPKSVVDDYDEQLMAAGRRAMTRQLATVQRKLAAHGLTLHTKDGNAVTAAGRRNKAAAGALATGIVIHDAWSDASWSDAVAAEVAPVAKAAAAAALATAVATVGSSALWGMNQDTSDAAKAATDRATALGQSIGARVNAAAATDDIEDGIADVLDDAGDTVANAMGAMAQVLANMASSTIQSYFAAQVGQYYSTATSTWYATNDDRTRPEHADADGQTVGIGDPFDVGGESLMCPGDPNGSDWNIINCRCWTEEEGLTAGETAPEQATADAG